MTPVEVVARHAEILRDRDVARPGVPAGSPSGFRDRDRV